MLIRTLVLLSTAMLNQKPVPILADVFIGDRGPYRFLVDTGAQTCLIDPKLASELGLKPAFHVDVLTQHSSQRLPALNARNLRIGAVPLPATELVFHDVAHLRQSGAPVRGLIGMNALSGLNFSLKPREGRLELDGERPSGEVVPFDVVAGRITLTARMGAEDLRLALDSGAGHAALFRLPAAMAKTPPVRAIMGTLEGARSVVPTTWTSPMTIGQSITIRTLPAAVVERKNAEVDGLLPASAFTTIYIDQSRREAVLVRPNPASAARN